MLLLVPVAVAAIAFVLLVRVLWSSTPPPASRGLINAAGIALATALATLVASGRLPWLAGVALAVVPYLRVPFRRPPRFEDAPRVPANGEEMTVERARAVLGLDPGANAKAVVAAHRALIQRLHPDRGGTTYLAAQLNDAKRVLLRDLKRSS